MFSESSRYFELPDLVYRTPDGREMTYKARRLVRGDLPVQERVTVAQSERLDLIAARTLHEPELFWQLCDLNEVLDPFEVEAGQSLKIPRL